MHFNLLFFPETVAGQWLYCPEPVHESGKALNLAPVPQPAGHGPSLDAGNDAHSGEQSDNGRPAVADKGEGKSHNRQDKQTHTHVKGDLAHEHTSHAHAHIGVEGGAGMTSYPDAPQDNERQKQQQGHTAYQSQLLAADSVDKVGVPGGEGIAAGRLGLNAVQIALAEESARTDGQGGAGLLPASSSDVQAVVKHHPEPHDPVIIPPTGLWQEKQPEDHRTQHKAAPHQEEPPQLNTGGPGHGDKDHHINDAHTEVAADNGNNPQHKNGVSADLDDGGDGADVQLAVLNFRDLKGQQKDEGYFNNLIGLYIHREARDYTGDDQPVQVAGVVVLP